MTGALLQVENVTSGVGSVPLLHDVSAHVEASELIALLGPNGSGKTTLMRTIVGLNRCWSGRLLLDGTDITTVAPHRRIQHGIGMVPAGHRLFHGLTVDENLRMGAFLVKDDAEVERRRELAYAYFPTLARYRRRIVGSMSGGEQQMCGISMGLMGRPRLLMIDELSMGLAPKVVHDLLATLLTIRDELGIAVVLVEQDVPTALEIADRAYVLDQGRVALAGSPRELARSDELRRIFVGAA